MKSARQYSRDITRESEDRVKSMLSLTNEKVRNIEIKNISNKIVFKKNLSDLDKKVSLLMETKKNKKSVIKACKYINNIIQPKNIDSKIKKYI